MEPEKLNSLTAALAYIEEHLAGDITQENCARAAMLLAFRIAEAFPQRIPPQRRGLHHAPPAHAWPPGIYSAAAPDFWTSR